MGNSTWYSGIDPILDEDYFKFNLADLSPEEQEEHKYWHLLYEEHRGMSDNAYAVKTTLEKINVRSPLTISNKRNLVLFEVKLLTFIHMIKDEEAVNILRMVKSSDEDNLYLAHVALKYFTDKRIHQFGNASVNENHRSKIYNDSANVCYEHLSHLINLAK